MRVDAESLFVVLPETAPADIGRVAKDFAENINRLRALALYLPALIGHSSVSTRILSQAELEVTGGLKLNPTEHDPETIERIRDATQKWSDVANAARQDPVTQNGMLEQGAREIERQLTADEWITVNSVESLLWSQVIGIWTIFEAIAGDLWEAAVNLHPRELAMLRGAPGRIIKRSKAIKPRGSSDLTADDSMKISLNTLAGMGFDVRDKMGTVLRREGRCRFDRIEHIRESYMIKPPTLSRG